MKPASDIHPKMYRYRRIVEAKLFIDAHYADKIDLDNISNQAAFSKYHFLRLFKSAFGKSPHKYLTEVRIQHAQKLLKSHPIANVCYAVGFESIPSFTKLFKAHTGLSPKAFSKRLQAQDQQQQAAPLTFVPHCFAKSYGWDE